jgi:hypothetical protein
MSRNLIVCLIAAGVLASASAAAAERQAYKYVDEKGNVTYSQTPPTQGKDIKKMDISPANSGRGGAVGGVQPGTNPYQQQYYSNRDEYQRAMQAQQKQREEAQQKRIADLKADCYRNRGTDCENPETLRNMEAQRIPGGGAYRREGRLQ